MAEITQVNDFLTIGEAPFTVAKIVKFRKHKEDDYTSFKTKPVTFIKKQVPGFRIFLIQAGFVEKPLKHIPDSIIAKQIDQMINWYAEHKTTNKRERNYYQIQK